MTAIPRSLPKQERARQTYERLLDVAGELLSEVGIDRVSTNLICARAEPGAVWILRALHSSPRLAHVRVESHRYVTGKLVEAYAPYLPHMSREDLWLYIRLTVELGFGADEMLYEETEVSANAAFRIAADMMRGGLGA